MYQFRVAPVAALIPFLISLAALFLVAAPLRAVGGRVLELRQIERFEPDEVEEIVGELFEGRSVPTAHYAIDAYIVRYSSFYPNDDPAVITAQLFVPRLDQPSPLYLFAPGTTGLVDACRPSREHIAGIHWGLYRAHVLAFAGKGFIGLLPDYTGFGEPDRLQPLFHARTEAKMMLDGVRAVTELTADDELRAVNLSPPLAPGGVFLAGFSQGGHAAFAAADYRDQYAPDLEIAGIIGYGPTTDIATLFREFPVVAPMVVKMFGDLYGTDRFPAQKMLQQRWQENLDHHVTRQCIGAMQSFYPWGARELFQEEFAEALFADRLEAEFPEIYRIMQRNSTGLNRHGVPAFILQGADDIVISPQSQERFVDALRAGGSEVRYQLYEDARHDTRQKGFREVLEWMYAQKNQD